MPSRPPFRGILYSLPIIYCIRRGSGLMGSTYVGRNWKLNNSCNLLWLYSPLIHRSLVKEQSSSRDGALRGESDLRFSSSFRCQRSCRNDIGRKRDLQVTCHRHRHRALCPTTTNYDPWPPQETLPKMNGVNYTVRISTSYRTVQYIIPFPLISVHRTARFTTFRPFPR